MRFVSTRQTSSSAGQPPSIPFDQMALCGLSPDGGLYMPETVPIVTPAELDAWSCLPYAELALRVFAKFIPEDIVPRDDLRGLIDKSYRGTAFPSTNPVPMSKLNDQMWLLELYHGPTLSFKDVALQFLGNLIEYLVGVKQRLKIVESSSSSSSTTSDHDDRPYLVLGATSGDTGSAAIAGFEGKAGVKVAILYPEGRVSPLQELQMVTVDGRNVRCLAIAGGTFDDCQNMVKRAFVDPTCPFRLIAVNSINFTRIMAQLVYYFYAYFQIQHRSRNRRRVSFVVPTGNFGNVFAGYYAKQMGLPIGSLVIGTNPNDILVRFWATGEYECRPVRATCAPSMDIQVSSNFERYLWMASGGVGQLVRGLLTDLSMTGSFQAPAEILQRMQHDFIAVAIDEPLIKATIKTIYQDTRRLVDPHSAVGVAAAMTLESEVVVEGDVMICLATADPAKFPETVYQSLQVDESINHPILQAIQAKPVKCKHVLPNNYDSILEFLQNTFI